jgi:hypothetical protein
MVTSISQPMHDVCAEAIPHVTHAIVKSLGGERGKVGKPIPRIGKLNASLSSVLRRLRDQSAQFMAR